MSDPLEFRRRLAEHERRFLRPARADLDELAAAIGYRGSDSGAAVWQAAIAAGRIPADWADDPQRRFRATRYAAQLAHPDAPLSLPVPPTAHAVLLFASDPEGLLEAERLARELVSRFEIFGCPPAQRVVWRVAGNPVARSRTRARSLGELAPAVARLRALLGGSERIYETRHSHRRFQPIVDALFWSQRWQALATSDISAQVLDAEPEVPAALLGRRLGDLHNPLEPWLALALTGYALVGVQRERGGDATIELAAPVVPPQVGLSKSAEARDKDPPRVVWSQRRTGARLACARADLGWLRRELPLLPDDDEPDQPRLIHFAVYGGPTALEVLAEQGRLELEARDRLARSALMLAASLPPAGPAGGTRAEIDVPISEIIGASACAWLLAAGADSEARDHQGWTALHHSAHARRLRCAAALIEGGAKLDAIDHRGRTPLMLAMIEHPQRGMEEMVELLLAAGADADARDHHGWTALHYLAAVSAGEGQRALARRLIERGARPSRDRAGRSPAAVCAWQGLRLRDGGPFDLRTSVAIGPGSPAPLIEPLLVGQLLDELVPELPYPAASPPAAPPPATSRSFDNWMVWADWLQDRGDPRGELVATSLARARVGGRKRRRVQATLDRLAQQSASSSEAAIWCADALAPVRPTPMQLRRTHGFVTAASLSACRFTTRKEPSSGTRREDLAVRRMFEATAKLLELEPLLAELRIEITGEAAWDSLVSVLRTIDPATRLRRLVLGGLPAQLPDLDSLHERFPALRSLWLIGESKIHSGVLRWPGLGHLRLRHGTTSEWVQGNVDLELELPDLTHLDLALPLGSRTSDEEVRGVARTLAELRVPHLRLSPMAQDFAAAILPSPLIPRLRTLELAGVRGSALETLLHRAELLRGLERVRVSITPAVAEQRRLVIEQLRQQLPQLELDARPSSRPPFAAWTR